MLATVREQHRDNVACMFFDGPLFVLRGDIRDVMTVRRGGLGGVDTPQFVATIVH